MRPQRWPKRKVLNQFRVRRVYSAWVLSCNIHLWSVSFRSFWCFFSPPNAARKHIGLYLIFFSNLHVICPTGTYDWNEIHKAGFVKHAKWGRIVKERMVPGVDVVWLFDPNDISKVLNNSGPNMYPQRKSHLGLQKYRKDRPHIYKTGGLLPTYAHAHYFTYLFILFYKSNRMNIINKICVWLQQRRWVVATAFRIAKRPQLTESREAISAACRSHHTRIHRTDSTDQRE